MPFSPDEIERLEVEVAKLLEERPQGLSEYDLIRSLRETGWGERMRMNDSLGLFRAHFLLFHVLYRLRDRWWQGGLAHLEINPLRIVRAPHKPGESGLVSVDPLRAYYLDLSHVQTTGEREVEELLQGFWLRLESVHERAAALAVLGLADPVDEETIKQRYRRLAMAHHPDRGGDDARLKEINRAMGVLGKTRA